MSSAHSPDRTACPARQRRRRTLACLALVAATSAVLIACHPTANATDCPVDGALATVEPPPDLEQLDLAVRDQYHQLVEELERARTVGPCGAIGAAWGRLAQWFDVYGYPASAGSGYRNAQSLQPEEPRWPYYLGRLEVADGRLDEAATRFRRAAELAPDEAAPRVRLATLALERDELESAEQALLEVLAAEPQQPGALLGLARVQLAQGRPEAAVETLRPVEGAQPEASEVSYTLGLAWRQLGEAERARRYLGRVDEENVLQIPLDPGFPWDTELHQLDVGARTLTQRGVRAAARGDHQAAAVLLGRAVAADPEGPEKRINYALALERLGRYPAARAELARALELAEPGSGLALKAHLVTGRLLAERGRPAEAIVHLEEVLAGDPGSLPAHLILGRTLHSQGDLEGALRHYGAARELPEAPDDVQFWHAALQLASGRPDAARRELVAEISRPDGSRQSRLLLARLLSTAPAPAPGDPTVAHQLLADGAPPDGVPDVFFAETAAMVAAAAGRFDEARAWQSAAIEVLGSLRSHLPVQTARRRLALYLEDQPSRTAWERSERLITLPVEPPPGLGPSLAPSVPEGSIALDSPTPAPPTPAAETGLRLGPATAPTTAASPAPATPGVILGAATDSPLLVDLAAATGLVFEHDNGRTGELYFVEPVGAGGALVDLDGDDDLDVILIQGRSLGPPAKAAGSGASNGGSRIFRNDLVRLPDGRRRLGFTDVTADSGFSFDGYGMGVATGDVDDDGRTDVYVTGFGPNQLWRNVSRGGRIRLENVTAEAGVDDPRWSTSASFADIDGDGHLDLYVTNYVDFDLASHRPCRSAGGRRDYCGPQSYSGVSDRLFLNRGDGTFRDVTTEAGIDEAGSGLGVVVDDFDRDGRLDIYVANDLERNFLWRNLGSDGKRDAVPRLRNVALETGTAVSMLGRAQASMGVVSGDVDNDGDPDLFMTHLSADTNTLYVNDGQGMFLDRSSPSGLGNPSMAETGFGTVLIDFDNDGWLDLFVANGAVKVIESQVRAGDPYPLKEVNHLYSNRRGRFVEMSAQAGPELERLEVSRGAMVGDVDQDGRSDVVVTNNGGPARLLHNRSRSEHGWLGLRLLTASGRDALGATVEVVLSDGRTLWRRAATDGSYLSANDPRVLVGLGDAEGISEVRVRWPHDPQRVETWTGLTPNRYHRLVAGQGRHDP